MPRHQGTKTLETERLLLRPFCADDAELMFYNWAGDSTVTRYLTWNPHGSIDESREILAQWTARADDPYFYNWAIVLKSLGEPIGSIGVIDKPTAASGDVDWYIGEVGYCIGKRWWGQKIASEALRAVLTFMFGEVELAAVSGRHFVENPRSGVVMQSCGMEPAGIAKDDYIDSAGYAHDMVVYHLTAGGWSAIQNQAAPTQYNSR